mmetsp:Transcript_45378/g.125037  ORF Transcript_45378/g.125037 Transcript_45378/m.125037 type:complete len:153 (+) Transcript_45378:85-543(+)
MAAGETTCGGAGSGDVSGSVHWCLHDDCTCETEPYASAEALATHFAEAHEPPPGRPSSWDRPRGAAAEDNGAGRRAGRVGAGRGGRKNIFLVLDIDQVRQQTQLYDGADAARRWRPAPSHIPRRRSVAFPDADRRPATVRRRWRAGCTAAST